MKSTKELLKQLHDVFVPKVIETELSEDIVTEEIIVEEVELADHVEEAPVETPAVEAQPTVEYATKLELQEFARTFLELLDSMQKVTEPKKDVPEALSKEEVELSVEEILHSPEVEVEKKTNLHNGNKNLNTIQSRINNKLFS
jgi:hypothetical protein